MVWRASRRGAREKGTVAWIKNWSMGVLSKASSSARHAKRVIA